MRGLHLSLKPVNLQAIVDRLSHNFYGFSLDHENHQRESRSLKFRDDFLFGIQKNRNFHSHHCQSHVRTVQSSNRAIIVRVQVYLSGIEKKIFCSAF